MKSHGALFGQITARDNLVAAARRAASGKRLRRPVARYMACLSEETEALQAELLSGTYYPGAFSRFRINDPKPRTIHCAPFRDRVVHQALCAVIGPVLERSMIADTFACRVGKGTHRAAARARLFCGRFRYYLKADIRRYFESVPHDKLLAVVLPLFRESAMRDLLERIIRHGETGISHGCGLPIGSLTSQWLANYYLNGLDHGVCRQWRCGGYLRYMDDFIFFDDDKQRLHRTFDQAREWLKACRGLEVKPSSVVCAPVSEGLEFVGLRIFASFWRLRRKRFLRTRKLHRACERAWIDGFTDDATLARSAASRCGLARWFGFKNLYAAGVEV